MHHDETCVLYLSQLTSRWIAKLQAWYTLKHRRRNCNGLRTRLFLLNTPIQAMMPASNPILRIVAKARDTGWESCDMPPTNRAI